MLDSRGDAQGRRRHRTRTIKAPSDAQTVRPARPLIPVVALRAAPAVGVAILLALFLACRSCRTGSRLIQPLRPSTIAALLQPPSLAHPFGTDNFGRDMLSRVIWASRIDLQIAIFATVFPMVFGTFAGCLLGYFGGIVDAVFRRLVDVIITIPFVVLVIAIVAVLGPGLTNMYLAISAVGWIVYARLVTGGGARRSGSWIMSRPARVMGYRAHASSSVTYCRMSRRR